MNPGIFKIVEPHEFEDSLYRCFEESNFQLLHGIMCLLFYYCILHTGLGTGSLCSLSFTWRNVQEVDF